MRGEKGAGVAKAGRPVEAAGAAQAVKKRGGIAQGVAQAAKEEAKGGR